MHLPTVQWCPLKVRLHLQIVAHWTPNTSANSLRVAVHTPTVIPSKNFLGDPNIAPEIRILEVWDNFPKTDPLSHSKSVDPKEWVTKIGTSAPFGSKILSSLRPTGHMRTRKFNAAYGPDYRVGGGREKGACQLQCSHSLSIVTITFEAPQSQSIPFLVNRVLQTLFEHCRHP